MKITQEELDERIKLHGKYMREEQDGVKLDLSNVDLSNVDLSNLELSCADLSNANLSNANLSYAYLRYANLRNADLGSANLRYANLRYANLRNADLDCADLSYADLDCEDLSNANLSNTNCNNLRNNSYKIVSAGGIGSAKRLTNYCVEQDQIWCGCFSGSLAEFEARIKTTYPEDNKYRKEYIACIDYFKILKQINVLTKEEQK